MGTGAAKGGRKGKSCEERGTSEKGPRAYLLKGMGAVVYSEAVRSAAGEGESVLSGTLG